jgi:hypothetical protein
MPVIQADETSNNEGASSTTDTTTESQLPPAPKMETQEGQQQQESTAGTDGAGTPTTTTPPDTFDLNNEDWGTYYDPQNIFCGDFDCYKILGFDYESFGKKIPDTKVITKRYRALSREWHPDKSKHKHAKERFVVSTVQFFYLCIL